MALSKPPYLAKVSPNGDIDSGFQIQQLSSYNTDLNTIYSGRFLTIQVDSINQKIRCVGSYLKNNEKGALVRYFNFDGSIDSTILPSGIIEIPILTEAVPYPFYSISKAVKIDDQRYLLAGPTEDEYLFLSLININGFLDTSFGNQGILIDTSATIMTMYSNTRIFAEIISNSVFISTFRFAGNQYQFETRKYNLDGSTDISFGNNGVNQFVPNNPGSYTFQMKKILGNKILLSCIDFSTSNFGDQLILDEFGNVSQPFNLMYNNPVYNESTMLINHIIQTDNNKIYVTGTNLDNQAFLMRFTENNLVPHLMFDGNAISSSIINVSVIYEWTYNGAVIPDASSSELDFRGLGEYVVTVSEPFDCGQYSDTLVLGTVDIKSSINNEIRVYPNPTAGILNIVSNELINNIDLVDLSGRILKSFALFARSADIDLTGIHSGIYLLRINSDRVTLISIE